MTFAFLFFDSVGGGEWLVLLAVVLIVVGPKNLPSAARKVGQVLAQLRRAADEFKRQIMTMDQEMEKAVADVKKDYIDIAQDVDHTVTDAAKDAAGAPVEPATDGAGGDLGDGIDRAYDYYGEDAYGDASDEHYGGDAGPEMAEHPAPAPEASARPAPSVDELKAVKITVSTAADRGEKA